MGGEGLEDGAKVALVQLAEPGNSPCAIVGASLPIGTVSQLICQLSIFCSVTERVFKDSYRENE